MSQAEIILLNQNHLSLSGELSKDTIPELLVQQKRLSVTNDFIVDLTKVDRADSAGVAFLIHWKREALKSGKKASFENMPPQMLAIARICGVDEILA